MVLHQSKQIGSLRAHRLLRHLLRSHLRRLLHLRRQRLLPACLHRGPFLLAAETLLLLCRLRLSAQWGQGFGVSQVVYNAGKGGLEVGRGGLVLAALALDLLEDLGAREKLGVAPAEVDGLLRVQ